MQIIHLIRRDDPAVIRRHQTIDSSVLAHRHEIETWILRGDQIERTPGGELLPLRSALDSAGPSLLHLYSASLPTSRVLRSIRIPWIAPAAPSRSWLSFTKPPQPTLVRATHPALGAPEAFPEAVDQTFFDLHGAPGSNTPAVGGLVDDEDSRSMFDAVRARITRTRDDVRWHAFPSRPSPEQLRPVDVWVDFGRASRNADNLVPEALVAGKIVVAPRTVLNTDRLMGGDAGFLVPIADANEMAHVIVNALFKPEIARPRLELASRHRERFDPSNRAEIIEQLYLEIHRDAIGP